jgi:hypothetical protein
MKTKALLVSLVASIVLAAPACGGASDPDPPPPEHTGKTESAQTSDGRPLPFGCLNNCSSAECKPISGGWQCFPLPTLF